MTTDSATARYAFATAAGVPLPAAFDGGRLTSDGGLPWLAEADTALHLCATVAAVIPEWRARRGRHPLETLVRQRIFQIACGYADQNDADTLRTDPLLKLVCGRLPDTGADLASQPTFSRLENVIDWRTCYRLAVVLVELYLTERGRAGVPKRILLDLDSTDDPTHGQQEGSRYHGYFRQHMCHPLLIFDGDTDQLITAILRPGNAHASRNVVPILRRLVAALRARWPAVEVEVRADSGFATPRLYTFCEHERLTYTIGLVPNERLEAVAAAMLAEAHQQRNETNAEKVRLVGECQYQAGSWDTPRRVVYKAEALPKGPNTRFVVTTRTDPAPLAVYDFYVDRGEPEGWVKDFKRACFADRLSCHRFLANQFRLLLHAAAYTSLDTVRRWLVQAGAERLQLDTLRLRVLKIGGVVRQRLHDVRLRLASSHPSEPLWQLLASHRGLHRHSSPP